jgi:NADH-quinone oxidoreductase subunit G
MTIASDSAAAKSAAPPPEDLVTVTIDGFEISVPKGTLIIRAAEQLGIQIPRFCDHPLLDPAGACRQCLVEVPDMGNGRGMPKPPASCTTTVMPGMVIKTQLTSKVSEKAQHGVMELLLINHPLDCPVCDKGGECPLQNQAMSNGQAESRFRDAKRTWPKPIAISPNVLLDRERCISCLRCVRFAEEIAGDPLIGMFDRGWKQEIATSEDVEFDSYFSGNTIQICPVGALTSSAYRFRSRPFDLISSPSVCEHCAVGCAQRTDHRRGKVLRRLAGDDPAVNEEWNCDKGRFAFTYVTQRDRILTPLVRGESGELAPASWPEALERAAEGLREAMDAGGVGVLPGGRLTYEDAYAYGKFARLALGGNDIDFRARPHSGEEAAFLASHVVGRSPETDGVTFADLEAAPATLLVGLEPEEEAPVLFLRLRKAWRKRQSKIFAIAPFTSLGLTKMAGTLLRTVPGAEPDALAALIDRDPSVAAAAEALRQPGSVILAGERLAGVPGAFTRVVRLSEATGAGIAWVPRRAGERGALEAGALPTVLPGGRDLNDPAARSEVEQVWGQPVPAEPGRDLTGILRAVVGGDLSGLVVGGVDPGDLPDPALAEAALDQAGFVLSLELRHSPVTARADVVLPVAAAVNKAGAYLNWEGRRRRFATTLETPNLSPDARVLDLVAAELDVTLGVGDVASIRAELAALGSAAAHGPVPSVQPADQPQPGAGEAVLATWSQLLDDGVMQAGEPHLAGTARRPEVLLSAATAAEIGVSAGADVAVATRRGSITLPLRVADLPDRVVWLPANSGGAGVRRVLGADAGGIVRISAAGAGGNGTSGGDQ